VGYTYSDFAGFRVPDEDAADDVPADLSYLVAQLDNVVILEATTTAERDSKFYDAPSGVICRVKNPDNAATDPGKVFGLYIKQSNAGTAQWGTLWEPPADLNFTAIPLADPYTTRGTPTYDPGLWLEPGGIFVQMTGAIVKVDGTQITSGQAIGYLPSNFLPLRPSGDYSCATAYHSANQGSSKVSLSADGTMTYYGPNVNWVGFDGIRYFRAQS
jgi:hypothetical protein